MVASIRTAVLLVAGTGSRLKPLTDNIPKALVSLGSETILVRLIRQLQECGTSRFVLATGYRHEAVEAATMSLGVPIEYCRNDQYASTQNSVSLLKCAVATSGESIIKLDGDLVLDIEILRRVVADSSPMVVAVDTSRELDQEAMKVEMDSAGFIRDFGKSMSVAKARAESIGVERLDADSNHAVMSRIAELVSDGINDRYYEDVYAELILDGKLTAKAVDIAGRPWAEVDTFDDLGVARRIVGLLAPPA